MTSPDTHAGAGAGHVVESGSLWLSMLRRCLIYCGAVILPMSVVAGATHGWEGTASTLFGAVVVVAFSGITLLIGHRAGPEHPTRALKLFILAYALKVVGFGAVLLVPGRPEWLVANWFLAAALAAVLAWQAAELRAFSASRRLLYAERGELP